MTFSQAPSASSADPTVVAGRYLVSEAIGRGGRATVYAADRHAAAPGRRK